jgi:hypothetical protein
LFAVRQCFRKEQLSTAHGVKNYRAKAHKIALESETMIPSHQESQRVMAGNAPACQQPLILFEQPQDLETIFAARVTCDYCGKMVLISGNVPMIDETMQATP